MSMTDLIAFLNARLDEDAAATRAALIAALIAGNRSPRALREIAAVRAILGRYGEPSADLDLGEHLQRSQEQAGLRFALCTLTAIWSDHPDYRAEWKP